jgi:hypothetical protein
MSLYTETIPVNLGPAYAGLDLAYQLYAVVNGANIGGPQLGGFREVGNGLYDLTITFDDANGATHGVKIYDPTTFPIVILARSIWTAPTSLIIVPPIVTVSAPVDPGDGNRLTLVQGDDHDTGDRLPSWTIENYAGPSLAGAMGKLRLLELWRYIRRGTDADAQLEVTATIAAAGSTITVTAPITAAQSALLSTFPPAGAQDTHKYQIVATTAGGKTVTLLIGPVSVTRRIEQPE